MGIQVKSYEQLRAEYMTHARRCASCNVRPGYRVYYFCIDECAEGQRLRDEIGNLFFRLAETGGDSGEEKIVLVGSAERTDGGSACCEVAPIGF